MSDTVTHVIPLSASSAGAALHHPVAPAGRQEQAELNR
jgi:hypothetical protein